MHKIGAVAAPLGSNSTVAVNFFSRNLLKKVDLCLLSLNEVSGVRIL